MKLASSLLSSMLFDSKVLALIPNLANYRKKHPFNFVFASTNIWNVLFVNEMNEIALLEIFQNLQDIWDKVLKSGLSKIF